MSFHSPEEVQKGLLLDGYEFKGSPLVVKTASDLPPQQCMLYLLSSVCVVDVLEGVAIIDSTKVY